MSNREAGLRLLPPRPDVCQECAADHTADEPHNADSLFYKYHFWLRHGRWPTWRDAIAHCSPEMQAKCVAYFRKLGIEVETTPKEVEH
jgi:hypothetical protein